MMLRVILTGEERRRRRRFSRMARAGRSSGILTCSRMFNFTSTCAAVWERYSKAGIRSLTRSLKRFMYVCSRLPLHPHVSWSVPWKIYRETGKTPTRRQCCACRGRDVVSRGDSSCSQLSPAGSASARGILTRLRSRRARASAEPCLAVGRRPAPGPDSHRWRHARASPSGPRCGARR